MKKIGIHLLALMLLFMPLAARAAGLQNPLAFGSLEEFLNALLKVFIQIGFPIVVLFIVFIGFRFVQHSAEGNAEELKKDRTLIFWALVGALILLGAQALAIAIQATVGDLQKGL